MFSTAFLAACMLILICGGIYAIATIGNDIPEDR